MAAIAILTFLGTATLGGANDQLREGALHHQAVINNPLWVDMKARAEEIRQRELDMMSVQPITVESMNRVSYFYSSITIFPLIPSTLIEQAH
jgi:hypothetical protein